MDVVAVHRLGLSILTRSTRRARRAVVVSRISWLPYVTDEWNGGTCGYHSADPPTPTRGAEGCEPSDGRHAAAIVAGVISPAAVILGTPALADCPTADDASVCRTSRSTGWWTGWWSSTAGESGWFGVLFELGVLPLDDQAAAR